MNRKNKPSVVTSIKTCPTQPRDLADRFHELQRLRKEVDDLEKKLAQHGARKVRGDLTGKGRN